MPDAVIDDLVFRESSAATGRGIAPADGRVSVALGTIRVVAEPNGNPGSQHIGTSRRPSLVQLGAVLALSWRGKGSDSHIWATTYAGAAFPMRMDWQDLDQQTGTSEGPALGVLGGVVVRYWKGSGDNNIWTASSLDGATGWSPQLIVIPNNPGQDFHTEHGPAIATVTF